MIAEIGDTANLVAWVGDQWTKTPDLVLHEESRWLSELPVLDSDRLAEGLIVARAPGKAVLLVSAFGKGPDTVYVNVKPSQPTVFAMHAPGRVGDGDTITLRGYRRDYLASTEMNRIITSPRAPVTIYSADSATVRFGIPTLPADPTCSPGAAATKIGLVNTHALVDLKVSRKREDEVVLGVGEWVRLSGPTHCVRLPAIPDAAYTVVYMDATTIERTKTGFESVWPEAHEFRVEDRSGVRVFGTMSTPRANLAVADRGPRDHARHVTRAASSGLPSPFWAFERDRPWELGETFYGYAPDGRWGEARVLGIWGKFVVAVFLQDSAQWMPDDYLARLDTVMTFINTEGLPILKAALGEAHPYTSVDADQLLILLSRFSSLQPGITSSTQTDDIVESLIDIDPSVLSNTNLAVYLFGHEIAHAWQRRYLMDTRERPYNGYGGGANWASEGGATFLGIELVRHRVGIGLLDNWEWYPSTRLGDPYRFYASEVAAAQGYFLTGYEDAASFIRDLVTRLVVAGVPYETAIANVSRGVIEGWWGGGFFGEHPRRTHAAHA